MKCLDFILVCLFIFPCLSFSQYVLNGTVKDRKGESIFAVNVYLKSAPKKGTTTDFKGNFSLSIGDSNDTLVISYISYKTQEISLKDLNFNEEVIIILEEKAHSLQEVVIEVKDPISEQFSVTKMDKLDVYLNPVSQGDPLKAITILPASTNTDETANPSLRGSSPDRSRVILNGIPIYNPVRASNISNQGFFSLFNPEVIDNMYVYASNPPLTYGNTSAGLVEIQTKKNLYANQLQLSTNLTGTGFFLSQNIKKDTSFVQVYGNYQFSDAFVGVQKDKLPNIKNFYITDAGINFHTKIGKKGEFNSFTYFINESFNGTYQSFTYKGDLATSKKRIFTVNNLKYFFQEGVLSINSGTNNSSQDFEFGNLNSNQNTRQVYTSVDYRWYILEDTNLQFGVSHDYHQNKFKDSIPTFYYALSPNSPVNLSKTDIDNHILEAYLYTNWDINDKFTFSSGMRSNFPIENQEYYFSTQLGLKYRINKKQRFLLSSGRYHNYSIPNFNAKNYNLLKSRQVALDYSYEQKNTLLKAATYFKNETGQQMIDNFLNVDEINTFGVEFFIEHSFYTYFKASLSNAYIDQKITAFEEKYSGANDFDYLIRTTVQYANPKLFSLALAFTSRPGILYNNITGGVFDNQSNFYEPVFSENFYDTQYDNYNRFDLSLSKYTSFEKGALIAFVTVNNIFDTQNQRKDLYNKDYSSRFFDLYQRRNIFFGVVWQLNY